MEIHITTEKILLKNKFESNQASRIISLAGVWGLATAEDVIRHYKNVISKIETQGSPWWSRGSDSVLPIQGA